MKSARLISPVLLATSIALCACGKDTSAPAGSVAVTETPADTSDPGTRTRGPCPGGTLGHWSFRQPKARLFPKSDLLFVIETDNAGALAATGRRAAAALSDYFHALPSGADLRVGVMLGHGPASAHSGRLYAPAGLPLVLNSKKQPLAMMELELRWMLAAAATDPTPSAGKALLSSLAASTAPSRRDEIRSQGFFREDAGLGVVLISAHADPGSPEAALAALESLQAGRPLAIDAITTGEHADSPIPALTGLAGGELLPAGAPNYAAPFSRLGNSASTRYAPVVEFTLEGAGRPAPSSVTAQVDGINVRSSYDPSTRKTTIPAEEAGGPGSTVGIDACTE